MLKMGALLAVAGAVGLGVMLLGSKEASAAPGTPGTDADKFIHPSERSNKNVANARFQIGQALNSGSANLMLQTADVIERNLGMPLTAQNLRFRANQIATGRPTTLPPSASAPKAPSGAPAQPAERVPPPDVIARMAQALATNLPANIRAEADKLQREGWVLQASELRKAADVIQEAQQVLTGGAPLPASPMILPSSSGQPGAGTPATPAPSTAVVDPMQLLAGKVVIMLRTSKKGSEDKDLVRLFQAQEQRLGRYTGTLDGLYGPKTAALLAVGYNIVPPKPWYWPKSGTTAAMAAYRKLMLAFASKDAPRADEWHAAAKV
jgi:hypothetical protein